MCAYWERSLAEHWPRIRSLLEQDVLYRARQIADGGTRALFADIQKHYDVKTALRDTPIPALVLYGTDDPARSAEAQLDVLFPHATKVMIADSGHFPWLENPAPFYAAIRAFLGTLPPS